MQNKASWPETGTLLRVLLVSALVALGIQYFLGIEVNMYVEAPYSSTDLLFSSHYSLGILVVAIGMGVLAVSILTRKPFAVLASLVAFVAMATAGQAGRVYTFSSHVESYSLIMAVAFLVAFASYFVEIILLSRSPAP